MRSFKTFDYIFITGVTGSGKSTLLQELLDTYNDVELLQKYTTRPMREEEKRIQKKRMEYQFIKEEDSIFLENMMDISVLTKYETVNGIWKYALPKYNKPREDITYIQVLGAGDILEILKGGHFPKNALLLNITVNEKAILEKLSNRMDEEESMRRYKDDCILYGIESKDTVGTRDDPFWNERISKYFPDTFTKETGSNYVEIENVMYFMTPKEIVTALKSIFTVPYENLHHLRIVKHQSTGLPMLRTCVKLKIQKMKGDDPVCLR